MLFNILIIQITIIIKITITMLRDLLRNIITVSQ